MEYADFLDYVRREIFGNREGVELVDRTDRRLAPTNIRIECNFNHDTFLSIYPKKGWKLYTFTEEQADTSLNPLTTAYFGSRVCWNSSTEQYKNLNPGSEPKAMLVRFVEAVMEGVPMPATVERPEDEEVIGTLTNYFFTRGTNDPPNLDGWPIHPSGLHTKSLTLQFRMFSKGYVRAWPRIFLRRRKRKAGRSALPKWLEQYDDLKKARRFKRNRNKLKKNPNAKGFGQSGTGGWKDKIRDAAKRIAVDAAKSAVSSATKGLTDDCAKRAGNAIKRRVAKTLRRLT